MKRSEIRERSISLNAAPDFIRATKKKRKRNAVRRCSVTTAAFGLRHAPYGARTSSGVPPRLCPKGVVVPKAQLGPGFVDTITESGACTASAVSTYSEHLARRS